MSVFGKQLMFHDMENLLFIPNEIFEDISNSAIKKVHIPFAYCYYYLISWLYRYAKYSSLKIDSKGLKQMLGYSPTFTEVDYIIKKNGILDQIRYTMCTKDYPVGWEIEEDQLQFLYLSDFDDEIQRMYKQNQSRKFNVKFPIKAFNRFINDAEMEEDYKNGYLDGTFFDVENTHSIPFEVFLYCMENKQISRTGFYIWSFLKSKCQIYDGYDISIDDLSAELSVPRSTLCKYLDVLRSYRMIECVHNQDFFCLALTDNEKKANTYCTNIYKDFLNNPLPYEKIKVVKKGEYQRMIEKHNKQKRIE